MFIESGVEYDVVWKVWGFYVIFLINGWLIRFNLKIVLVKN